MADFFLPKNSKVQKGTVHAAKTDGKVKKFKVYRYDPDSGEKRAVRLIDTAGLRRVEHIAHTPLDELSLLVGTQVAGQISKSGLHLPLFSPPPLRGQAVSPHD